MKGTLDLREEFSTAQKNITIAEEKLTLAWKYLDCDSKQDRLTSINLELSDPSSWENIELSRSLNQEKSTLEKHLNSVKNCIQQSTELLEIVNFIQEDWDEDMAVDCIKESKILTINADEIEFKRMFNDPLDPNATYLEIQAGSGGTEAQDWAQMLMRMYIRWSDSKGFIADIEELSRGETAGIKSATIKITGDYAYGWLRTESGIHRLVRKSPFDSGSRRHTSFASVFIVPEIDDKIDIDIDQSDLRIDTYRASGAGGQHVNKTDSAVRLTHIPTSIVVQCQSQRSQHKNKAAAMKQLRAKLYELEQQKQEALKNNITSVKTDISWGNQIRSYVLDDSRIKDLRTGIETGKCDVFLDGDIDAFLKESLRQQVKK